MNSKNNRYIKHKNEKGAISLFVVLSMLFFLVFVVGSYTMVSRRNQQQAESNAELKNTYVRDGEEQYDALLTTSTDGYIPIKTKKDYYAMATGGEIYDTTTGFTYIAVPNAKYRIKSTITIPMEEIAGYNGDNISDDYRFKDYLIYKTDDDDYNEGDGIIDDGTIVELEDGVDIVYTFEGENYKLLAYSETGNKFEGVNFSTVYTTGTEDEFCMYGNTSLYSSEPHNLLIYVADSADGKFKDLKKDENYFIENIYGNVADKPFKNLNYIKDFTSTTKYFVFVKYEKSSAVIGKKLSEVVNVGDYVNYKLDYSKLVGESVEEQSKVGWRVINKEYDSSKNSYVIKLIAEGTPIKYKSTDKVQDYDKMSNDDFEITLFDQINGKGKVLGSYFKNAYAESVQALNYSMVSLAVTEKDNVDLVTAMGGDIKKVNLSESKKYEYNTDLYKTTKNGLFDNGTNYWIGKIGADVKKLHYANRKNNEHVEIAEAKNDKTYGIRPVVTLIDNLTIVASEDGRVGDGSKSNPYDIRISTKYTSGPKVGDYVSYVDYANVTVNDKTGGSKKSDLTGWRILNIADDGTIKLVSAGIPYKYKGIVKTDAEAKEADEKTYKTRLKSELYDNFTKTRLYDSAGGEVNGDKLLKTEFATEIECLSYEDLSNLVYGNADYLTVSKQEINTNVLDDDAFRKVINDWNERKVKLVNVDSDYILATSDGSRKVIKSKGNKSGSIVTNEDWTEVGLRIVVTLKRTTKFITGTGTKEDPYKLSANATSEMAPFRVGDYVTYSEIPTYTSVGNLSDSNGKTVSQTGWRVLSYKKEGETQTLKLVSAGIPYYTSAFNTPALNGKDYAEEIKAFNFTKLDFKDSRGEKLTADKSPYKTENRITKVEALDYDQYCSLLKLYTNREVSKDLLYLNQYYWLGSYYEYTSNGVKGYRLRYATTSTDSSLIGEKTYGIRPVITISSTFEVEVHSGTASDPHVLKFGK